MCIRDSGYIALSAKLQNNPEWKGMLKEKMGTIDFTRNNPLWKQMGLVRKKHANKALRNKLYQFCLLYTSLSISTKNFLFLPRYSATKNPSHLPEKNTSSG